MKFVCVEKRSKKEQAKFNNIFRGNWGTLNPVSRKHKSKKDFKREKGPSKYDLM